jgi:hypothetical protein
MEPLNDPLTEEELNEYLRVWQAPDAPMGLKPPGAPRVPWWRWLVSGSIRVPVPAGLLAVVIVALWSTGRWRRARQWKSRDAR